MTDGPPEWSAGPLRARRERTPDRLALVEADTGDEWTYGEFDALVDRVVAGLADAGTGPDATVATLLGTRPLSVALLFATIRRGSTLAPLNVELDREALSAAIDRLDPDLLLCGKATEATATVASDGHIASVDPPSESAVDGFAPSAPDTIDADAVPNVGPRSPDRTALVAFTSGTTGRPKGVRLSVGTLLESATASALRLGVTPRDRWFSPLSTYHVGGIAPYVRSTLYGTTAVMQREFEAEAAVRAIDELDANCVSFVPTMLSRVLDAGWRPGPDFRFVLLGGGPAPESLLERCLDRGVPVCPTYGATETASQVATATPGEVLERPGTVGRPLVGADVRVVVDGSPCEPGEVGELVVDGPMVSPGYLDDGATAASFEGGGFRTGDLGYRDADGRLWIVGRADDAIVTGGENVQPATVAEALADHPAVADVAVVGVPDEEWGERVAALVVVDGAGTTASTAAEDLREYVRDRVPAFAIPKSIAFVDELPRTPSGTVDRTAVREHFE